MASNATTVAVAVGAAIVGAVISLSMTGRGRPEGAVIPRTADNRPDLNGIWQTTSGAHWDLEAHRARPGAVTQQGVYNTDYEFARVAAAPVVALGAAAGVPASLGVVQGDGKIPYTPEALKKKQDNVQHWIDRDPELKCYLPGIPRATYMPYPFQIVQSGNKIQVIYEFANATRTIHLDTVDGPPIDLWMGHSVGHWEGDTLVVDVRNFNDKTWLSRAGDFHSDALHVVEKFTPVSADAMRYEATIEDPNVYTKPWTISVPIYKRLEPDIQLLDYQCFDFAEEFLYGNLRRQPLVKHWEGETMSIDVTRKVPPEDRLYDWYGK